MLEMNTFDHKLSTISTLYYYFHIKISTAYYQNEFEHYDNKYFII